MEFIIKDLYCDNPQTTLDQRPNVITTCSTGGIYTIQSDFTDNPIVLSRINETHILNISDITSLELLDEDSTRFYIDGITETRLLEINYRLIKKGRLSPEDYRKLVQNNCETVQDSNICTLSNDSIDGWVDSLKCLPEINPNETYTLQIRFKRTGTSTTGYIYIYGFEFLGECFRKESLYPTFSLKPGETIYYTNPQNYKVFKLTDFGIAYRVKQDTSSRCPVRRICEQNLTDHLKIRYRISQDNGRTWSQFEPLTKENISTVKYSKIRFFKIEYEITSLSEVNVYDIFLIGEFDNVTENYFKTNLLGIRNYVYKQGVCYDDCNNKIEYYDIEGSASASSCAGLDPIFLNGNSDDSKANFFNPYDMNQSLAVYNKASNDVTDIFGHNIVYGRVSPDQNGSDPILMEHQLYNIDCIKEFKVLVPDNKFPDSNAYSYTPFDLSLVDSFEIHITKQSFKQAFGETERPSKEDYVYFPVISKLFRIEHSVAFREFNNAATYYKVILVKASKNANIKPSDSNVKARFDKITNNSTIMELLGEERNAEIKEVANTDQFRTLSQDIVRERFDVKIGTEMIDNADLTISKYHYDLSSIPYSDLAVVYKNGDNYLKKSDNRSFVFWFKINSLDTNSSKYETQVYNLITNYDYSTQLGYKIDIVNSDHIMSGTNTEINFYINDETFSITADLKKEIWYCYTANLDNRQRTITQYVYSRNLNNELYGDRLKTTVLKLIKKQNYIMDDAMSFDITEQCSDSNVTSAMHINASSMKLTNIRILNNIIPEAQHTKILNSTIIRDTQFIIVADNANQKPIVENEYYNNEFYKPLQQRKIWSKL